MFRSTGKLHRFVANTSNLARGSHHFWNSHSGATLFAFSQSNKSINLTDGSLRYWNGDKSLIKSQHLWFSTVEALSNHEQPIRILYASQTGTAKMFSHQLYDHLSQEFPLRQVTVQGWHETQSPNQLLQPGKALHVFLTSVAGVGEPPDNGRKFYNWIMNEGNADLKGLEYAVFGLGSTAGHAAYFNVIGKSLDKRLEDLGASRILEIGLGDDGDCIEDDYDTWMEKFVSLVSDPPSTQAEEIRDVDMEKVVYDARDALDVELQREQIQQHSRESFDKSHQASLSIERYAEYDRVMCPGVALSSDEMRLISKTFPTLNLRPRESQIVRKNLFHLNETSEQFYAPGTANLGVVSNKVLGIEAGESGLHEMKVELDCTVSKTGPKYETGDHLVVYPQNSRCIVEAYLKFLDVDQHAIIAEEGQPSSYPYPKGLTVSETLTHCIDLGALPSPSFARSIMGKRDIDYKDEVAYRRRTVLDLCLQQNHHLSLEDFLFQAMPMKPRYYSIASSNLSHPNEIRLVYRKVEYVTKLGMLREGICTSYLSHKGYIGTSNLAHIAAYVNTNPTFRLPKTTNTPLLFIAGGAGVAPIRGLIEERVTLASNNQLGPATLYLGFRSPDDEVYRERIEDAIKLGALTEAKIAYSTGCKNGNNREVTDVIRDNGADIWEHWESGGVIFLCGGARSFGAAVESVFLDIIQEYGHLEFAGAESYLRRLIRNGQVMDDLAD